MEEKFLFKQSYALPAASPRAAQPDEDQSSGHGTESLDPLDQVKQPLAGDNSRK